MTDPYEDELSIEQELEEQGREMGHTDPGTRSPLADVARWLGYGRNAWQWRSKVLACEVPRPTVLHQGAG